MHTMQRLDIYLVGYGREGERKGREKGDKERNRGGEERSQRRWKRKELRLETEGRSASLGGGWWDGVGSAYLLKEQDRPLH